MKFQDILTHGSPLFLSLLHRHDPRVSFWEPSKFAATLRHESSNGDDRPICVKMDMSAGHFSASDRYKYYRELAVDYCFLLDQLGLVDK
jgi:oligopeptidase B